MKFKKRCSMLLILIFLSACSSNNSIYTLQALHEIQHEEYNIKDTIIITYNNNEVLTYKKTVLYQSSDDNFMNDYMNRVKKIQSIMTQSEYIKVQINKDEDTLQYEEEIPFHQMSVEELVAIDPNLQAFIKDNVFDIDTIEAYLIDQGYSTSKEDDS